MNSDDFKSVVKKLSKTFFEKNNSANNYMFGCNNYFNIYCFYRA